VRRRTNPQNMGKTVVIVGSGMGGLSAGIYSRLNGLDAEILEQQPVPGGLVQVCVTYIFLPEKTVFILQSWQRGRFLLDGCVHWIAGSTGWPSTFQSLYRDLGFLPRTTKDGTSVAGISFLHFDEFSRFEPRLPAESVSQSRNRSRSCCSPACLYLPRSAPDLSSQLSSRVTSRSAVSIYMKQLSGVTQVCPPLWAPVCQNDAIPQDGRWQPWLPIRSLSIG